MVSLPFSTTSASAVETERIAATLSARLVPGDIVLISGELGAGKTTFVRGAARALGVADPVTSPTFTVGQRYSAAPPLRYVAHVDLYRLASLEHEDPDLLADYTGAAIVTFVEWPAAGREWLEGLGRVAMRVTLAHLGGESRSIEAA